MKKFAMSVALGASLVSTAAFAAPQRPTYLAFSAPAALPTSVVAAPATPKVAKRNNGFASLPLVLPILGVVAAVGLVAAVASGGGGDSSPG